MQRTNRGAGPVADDPVHSPAGRGSQLPSRSSRNRLQACDGLTTVVGAARGWPDVGGMVSRDASPRLCSRCTRHPGTSLPSPVVISGAPWQMSSTRAGPALVGWLLGAGLAGPAGAPNRPAMTGAMRLALVAAATPIVQPRGPSGRHPKNCKDCLERANPSQKRKDRQRGRANASAGNDSLIIGRPPPAGIRSHLRAKPLQNYPA